jgi:hypothetical protein
MFAPHEVPFALLVVSMQVMPPVAHDVVPFLQGLAGLHVIPAMHPPHAPLLHT